jgi:hypothetical protein
VRRLRASYNAILPKTAPYLGVACLALLAFASGYALPAALAYLSDGRSGQLSSASWLTGANPSRALYRAIRLAARRADLGARGLARRTVAAATRSAAPRPRSDAWPASPLIRGALSVPALLVSVALARCH